MTDELRVAGDTNDTATPERIPVPTALAPLGGQPPNHQGVLANANLAELDRTGRAAIQSVIDFLIQTEAALIKAPHPTLAQAHSVLNFGIEHYKFMLEQLPKL